jgi:hypothetical protein
MGEESKRNRRVLYLTSFLVLLAGFLTWILFFTTPGQPWWKILSRESRRILGWEEDWMPPEERRIREEVILKKMREANSDEDWRTFAPEYPRPRKMESLTAEEKKKVLRDSPEFQEMDRELKAYLRKKEDLLYPELPLPSIQDAANLTHLKDKATDKVMDRLLSKKEIPSQEKPLEENLRLGIKGPLVSRKILERPSLPQVRVKMEADIEMTLWVLPNGLVDRVVPSVRGDAELERVSIQYLKQWRFVPLGKDQPQAEQWGTIPIKFRLQ